MDRATTVRAVAIGVVLFAAAALFSSIAPQARHIGRSAEAHAGASAAMPAARLAATQVPPASPAPPAPPVPPLAAESPVNEGPFDWTWARVGSRVRVESRGTIELTGDERDVLAVSPGGYFDVSDGGPGWFRRAGRQYVVRGNTDGSLSRRFTIDGVERPVDADAREWIADAILRLVRGSGWNAEARVARILARDGAGGVLEEISQLSGDFARAVYFAQLVEQAPPDREVTARAIRQAGREIRSDFELARVLIAFADVVGRDETLAVAFLEATRSLRSDFEHARVLTSLMARERPGVAAGSGGDARTPAIARAVLESSLSIRSDFEKGRVLTRAVQTYELDDEGRTALFAAVRTMRSDFEKARVLSAAAQEHGTREDVLQGIAQATAGFGSDFERARVLMQVVAHQPKEPETRQALLAAARSIRSSHERGRVLSAMLEQGAL